MAEAPDLSRRIVYRIDGMDQVGVRRDIPYREGEATLLADVYSPPGLRPEARLPAVLFVHGGPVPPPTPSPRRWGVFESYGALAAASGLVGVTFDHRLHAPGDYARAESDVRAAVGHVRDHADELRVDRERIALWAFSGGGPLLSWALRERPSYVRCVVAFYALLDLRHVTPPDAGPAVQEHVSALSPAAQVDSRVTGLPVFVARAGLDSAVINTAVDRFVREGLAVNMQLDVANHARGQHAFDVLDDDARSREIIARAVAFVRAHTLGSERGGGGAAS